MNSVVNEFTLFAEFETKAAVFLRRRVLLECLDDRLAADLLLKLDKRIEKRLWSRRTPKRRASIAIATAST